MAREFKPKIIDYSRREKKKNILKKISHIKDLRNFRMMGLIGKKNQKLMYK